MAEESRSELVKPKNDQDFRLERISSYVLTTLKLKQEKWQKMITTDELKVIVLDWLNNPQRRILIFTLNSAGFLIPMLNFPFTIPSSTPSIPSTSSASIWGTTLTSQNLPLTTSTSQIVAKGKSVYFIKKIPCTVTFDNFHKEILFGDLPTYTVKSLAILVDEIFLPLLNNPFNRKLWPDIVSKDLEAQTNKLQNILTEVKGNISNKTILSITVPSKIIFDVEEKVLHGDLSTCNSNFRNTLEGMIINWTQQIHNVLSDKPINFSSMSSSSTIAIRKNADIIENYLPANEITYWSTRYQNLQNIYEQINSPSIKSIANILENINSVYFQIFTKIFKELILGLRESQDISLWLNPLIKFTSRFNEVNFINSKILIEPLVHIVQLISIKSKYYCTTKRIVTLLRTICNLLVHRAYDDLEPTMLFHGEADEGLMKITRTIEILEYFKFQVGEYRTKNLLNVDEIGDRNAEGNEQNIITTSNNTSGGSGIFPNSSWSFQLIDVFMKLNKFLGQLKELKRIFETAVCFQNLEKLEIGGLRGKFLTDQIIGIYGEFKKLFHNWTFIEINLLDENAKWKKFQKEQIKFFENSNKIEKKLGTILVKAFQDCSNSEQFIKLIQMSGNILKRSEILPDLKGILPNIFKFFLNDLNEIENLCKRVFDEYESTVNLNAIPIDINFPAIAGTFMWIHKLCCRIFKNSENIFLPDYRFITTENNKILSKYQKDLIENLLKFKKDIWSNWINQIESQLDSALNQYIYKFELLTINPLDENSKTNNKIIQYTKDDNIINLNRNFNNLPTHIIDEFHVVNTNDLRKLKYILKINIPSEFTSTLRELKCLNSLMTLQKQNFNYFEKLNDFIIISNNNNNNIDDNTSNSKCNDIDDIVIDNNIPENIEIFYKNQDEFWERTIKLSRIEDWYNKIHKDCRSCEFILIENELNQVDFEIREISRTMTWQCYDENLIEKIYRILQDIYNRLNQIQQNFNLVLEYIRKWIKDPLNHRNSKGILDIDCQKQRLRNRIDDCKNIKDLIDDMILKNFQLFFGHSKMDKQFEENIIDENLNNDIEYYVRMEKSYSEEHMKLFKKYREFVDRIIGDELLDSVKISLQYLKNEMENSNNCSSSSTTFPLFLVKLELKDNEINFIPSFKQNTENNFLTIIETLVQNILDTCQYIPRISDSYPLQKSIIKKDTINGTTSSVFESTTNIENATYIHDDESTFASYVCQDEEIKMSCKWIIDFTIKTMNEAIKYSKIYDQFKYLWLNEMDEHLKNFLKNTQNIHINIAFGLDDNDDKDKTNLTLVTCVQCKTLSLEKFKEEIDRYQELYEDIENFDTYQIFNGWLAVDFKPLKQSVLNTICKWTNLYKQWLIRYVVDCLKSLETFIDNGMKILTLEVKQNDLNNLLRIMSIQLEIKECEPDIDNMFKPIKDIINLLKQYNFDFNINIYKKIEQLPKLWINFKNSAQQCNQKILDIQVYQRDNIKKYIILFNCRLNSYRDKFVKMMFFSVPCKNIYNLCDKVNKELKQLKNQQHKLIYCARLLSILPPDDSILKICYQEIKQIKQLWDFVRVIESCIIDWKCTPWRKIDADDMENECRKFTRDLRTLDKNVRLWQPYIYMEGILKDLVSSLRAITELQNPAITERHWIELMHTTKVSFKTNISTTLADLLTLNLHHFEEEVKNTVDKAIKEMFALKILNEIKYSWYNIEFEMDLQYQNRKIKLLKVSEELVELLDDNQMQLQNISTTKYIEFLLPKIQKWQNILTNIDTLITLWFEVQRKWIYLESIFIGSIDIRSQLPDDAKSFEDIDMKFIKLLNEINISKKIIKIVLEQPEIYMILNDILQKLIICEKALNNYLETKRLTFPRFYFISSADLLDILSNGNNPKLVDRHLIKLFDSILKLKYEIVNSSNMNYSTDVENSYKSMEIEIYKAIGMYSKENDEYVKFIENFQCSGRVELWLNELINQMRKTLKFIFKSSLMEMQPMTVPLKRNCNKLNIQIFNTDQNIYKKSRDQWLFDWPAQTALCCSQICWTSDVNCTFEWLEEGYESSMKEFHKKQIQQLNSLINLLLGELSCGDRQKIMTICTIDVHCRDVVMKIIQSKVNNSMTFQWQSQLRHRWDSNIEDCFANICDAEFRYDYEYLGNTTRLVITPLTDRCYITLTQSLHLVMGGAPAGPAGTGKTETTKDLGRALGVMVYVFNCSEQMDYKSCGNIYKGLSQTGAWGCFDEFNRISVEVLSVVAVQVKTIQDAIKAKKSKFFFMGEQISLIPSVGIFITMNPGYAGRTELPENLKTLFRPCAMIVPDFALICEIMLVAEGFQNARILARKFITLYTLCRELLSKQDHYDWGLRAIKSVLVVAGALKRSDHNRPEDQVLMRALRDFNIPKIVTEDISIFMGLIGDLFPALDVPRKRFLEFEKTIRKAGNEIKLQPEESFVIKVVQLQELLDVRHSVFIVGNAGTGKTRIWQTLLATYRLQNLKPHFNVLNPKALTNDELFGTVNPTTREWKDGLFSSIMRDQANLSDDSPKWIILDGDIDPMWIESLNTLMDDNKVLTLASNERITLKKAMRLLFEVGHLKAATPATVSRAGILYINPQDLGWSPYVSSWIETRENIVERGILTSLFEKYFPSLVKNNKRFMKITPISNISMIQLTCFLLECLLDGQKITTKSLEKNLEIIFVFSAIWGFGSGLYQDHLIDWRREFHKWWICEFKDIKFPSNGYIFDFCLELDNYKFRTWESLIPKFDMDPEIPLQNVLVPTIETVRLTYFLKKLISKNHPVMLVGGSGCGKNSIYREIFNSYDDGDILIKTSHFNFYTTSEIFQKILDHPIEKKSGRYFGPTGNKKLIYYVSDLNMPEVDSYGTVQPHTIIRQFMDYQHWYDRNKLILKYIKNCQFATSMNPTAGSFTIDSRLQRHFCIFSVNQPTDDILVHIYSTILRQHLNSEENFFSKDIKLLGKNLCKIGIELHKRIENVFLPTAVKFHYIFNLRDLTNIFQGLLNITNQICVKSMDLIRFYLHESYRVYHDKLIDPNDIKTFRTICKDILKKDIEDFDEEYVFNEPLIYCNFAQSLLDQKYMPIKNWKNLYELLMEAQSNYNEIVGYMNLVMFEDAMIHVCRINRILESPRGNALLIGVGGSGKQTLARLAAFISSLSVFQIQLKRGYSITDMKDDLGNLYIKVGIKNVSSVFLMSDAQIPDESLLMLVNDMLASGEIQDLYTDDQFDTIINGVRNEVKQNGTLDTKENCWNYFIEKVRRLLKIVLCFSPVGPTLRIRARKFPAIISRTSIDWFHEWPKTALESVSKKFLSEIDVLPEKLVDPIGSFMAYVHGTVNQISKIYLQNEKRYNYTTPKTFLEYISLYLKLLSDKSKEHLNRINRLDSGMSKLAECARQVDMLQDQLAIQEIELHAKNAAADKLIVIVSAENEKVKKEKFIAFEEEKRVRIIEEDVCIKTKMCEEDLRKAEPALVAAQAALNTLNKNNLTELKSFGSPPKAVINVCSAVMVLLAPNGKIPKDRSWKMAKLMMVKVDQFLNDLVNYDKDNIHPNIIESLQDYLKDSEFNPDNIVQKSVAAAGLCAWVINIHRYHEVFLIVGPKQQALQDSQDELQQARERLEYLKMKIINLEKKLSKIQSEFNDALAEKQRCQLEADKTSFTIDLAHRLVNGLANENIRWKESVTSLKEKIMTLPGDILLISSFLSYVGSFTRRYRQELQDKMWMPTFKKIEPIIPHTEDVDALTLISDDAQIAIWNNEGLPMDRMSTENATILTNSTRWPLMIDPQLQGLKWIKNQFGDQLIILRLSQKGYLDIIEKAMAAGDTILFEQIGETLDAVLEPLLSRALIKKGKFIKIGDREMDFHSNFRLILHTKIPNPHYKPEMQAQTNLINFTVTRDGLEEQLLAEVVKIERPDLEEMKTHVTIQQNKFKISLKVLEDELLVRLASAGKNVLEEHALVLNLEATKKTVNDIELKVSEAKVTTWKIDQTRDIYRSAAKRASILYFVLMDLHKINPIYKFSLKSFMIVFKRSIAMAIKDNLDNNDNDDDKNLKKRVNALVDSITYQTFLYTTKGLFEKDKLIFTSHMILRIMINAKQVSRDEIDFLLRYPHDPNTLSPYEFISRSSWGGIKNLTLMEYFYGIDKDIENYTKRWKKFLASETIEKEIFPGEWKLRTPLQKLCIIRALRPDRMTYAMKLFIEQTMGKQYIQEKIIPFNETYNEITFSTPVFFILSPGINPVNDVEKLGRKLNFTSDNANFHNISLGQGQENIAENAIKIASINGHWVILQNIHLVAKWLPTLEKLIEKTSTISHTDYRLFISAEPAPDSECHVIPQGILESSIKIVNEPPTGMAANLHKAWDNFNQDTLETCTQEAEFKSILFSLCYFHAVLTERRKFGAQGWNKIYPFNVGDLTISANVLYNYLESSSNRTPWEDLRYLFGEIMYGGHITDDWDRRLCRTYLDELMQQDLIDGDFKLCSDFPAPPNLDFNGYHTFINDYLPDESPILYGLHPNAEIGFLTTASENLLKTIFELQPRESELSNNCGASREELVKIMIDDFLDKLQDEFNMIDLIGRVEKKTPYNVVALQECERMNILIREIKRSLRELMLGLKGELTITVEMETLDNSIFYDLVPESWTKLAYPSLLGLQGWFVDLIFRIKDLASWVSDFHLPPSIWLGGLFNPQSFLTAIMQASARTNDLPLDKMCINCEVTQKDKDDLISPPKEGSFLHGLFLDGASWDCSINSIVSLRPKELFSLMPVFYVKSIIQEKQELQRIYECPLYKTRARGSTFVWTFNLRTKEKPSKWILGGVALLLQT